jgi:chorismate synthase
LDGLPAGVGLTSPDVERALARRRLGYGRGARMSFERDQVRLTGGLRHGRTLGSPLSIEIANSEWPKWRSVMAADPLDQAEQADAADSARQAALTRPRPGHADLAGMSKFDFDDARPILERASARETAARVALGEAARQFLDQALGVRLISHVTAIGPRQSGPVQLGPDDLARIDADPMRCADPTASSAMRAEVDDAQAAGDTLGGRFEVLVFGCPPGLGSHVMGDRRLDARLAAALMSIPAIKGVEVGLGFELAELRGSAAHDQIVPLDGGLTRLSQRAGGIEGGISNGGTITLRAAMKPIATVPRALGTVDLRTGLAALAHHQRSDVCAVPAAAVVGEAMVALVMAEAVLDKFGGDSLDEVRQSAQRYRRRLAERGLEIR